MDSPERPVVSEGNRAGGVQSVLAPSSTPPLHRKALKLRRHRRIIVLLLRSATIGLASCALSLVLALVLSPNKLFIVPWLLGVIGILSAYAAALLSFVWAWTPCPLCRHRFFANTGRTFWRPWWTSLGTTCATCGLSIEDEDVDYYRMLEGGSPICAQCGYDLTGLAAPRCPECGTEFDRALLR